MEADETTDHHGGEQKRRSAPGMQKGRWMTDEWTGEAEGPTEDGFESGEEHRGT